MPPTTPPIIPHCVDVFFGTPVTVGAAVVGAVVNGANVGAVVGVSVGASVGAVVGASVGDSVGDSVGHSVGAVVGTSVGAVVRHDGGFVHDCTLVLFGHGNPPFFMSAGCTTVADDVCIPLQLQLD